VNRRSRTTWLSTLRLLPRAALVAAVVASPLLAASAVHADFGGTIEAPAIKKVGAGFVLMVSLQRA
jgi:hypothetical protein